MNHHVILTCGVSLFSGFNEFRKWTNGLEIFRFERTNPLPLEGETEEAAMAAWIKACRETDLSQIAHGHPENVSAEYSMLNALRTENRLGPTPHVELIHTDSLGGRAAVELLARLIESDFNAHVNQRKVLDIDPGNRVRLRQSLGNYMVTVGRCLENGNPHTTCFAPVGGYKVMTSLGYLVGAYLGFQTAYLHEDNQSLHDIPAVPIHVAPDVLRATAPLLRRLRRKDHEWSELSRDDQELVGRHPYLFDRLDASVGINAFALFLMERPENRKLFGPTLRLSPEARKEIDEGSRQEFVRNQIIGLHNKLQSPAEHKAELRHDKTFSSLKGSTFQLYKGARGGGLTFTAAYLYDDNADVLCINRIWTNHDAYENDAERGNGFFDNREDIQWADFGEWCFDAEI